MVTQFAVTGLIDSGCTGSCIDIGLVQRHNIPTKKLMVPQPVYNADGTLNSLGKITDYVNVRMTILDHSEMIQLAVTKLGNPELFVGLDWFRLHNPSIDWSHDCHLIDALMHAGTWPISWTLKLMNRTILNQL